MANEREIVLDYGFYKPPQYEIFVRCKGRIIGVKAGRQFGKSRGARFWLLDECLSNEHIELPGYWISPTIEQARKVFDKFQKEFSVAIRRSNISRRQVVLYNGREIFFCGCDNPGSIEGDGAWAMVFDEARNVNTGEVWENTLRPMTMFASRFGGGRVVLISTPKSRQHWFSQLIARIQKGEEGPEAKAFVFSTLEGGNIPESEIERARRTTPKDIFDRNYLGIDSSLEGIIYREFDPKIHLLDSIPKDFHADFHVVGLDFGATEDHPTVFIVLACEIRTGRNIVVDEIYIPNCNQYAVTDAAMRLKANYQPKYYSCDHNRADFVDALNRDGHRAVLAKKDVLWGIEEVRKLLFNRPKVEGTLAAGPRLFFLRHKSKKVCDEIENYCYKPGTEIPNKGAGFDDGMDALRYVVTSLLKPQGKISAIR